MGRFGKLNFKAMMQEIIIPIYGLKKDQALNWFQLTDLTISTDPNLISKKFGDPHFMTSVGNIHYKDLLSQVCLYAVVSHGQNPYSIIEKLNGEGGELLNEVWLVKDCAMYTKTAYSNIALEGGHSNVITNTRMLYPTAASGDYSISTLNIEELKLTLEYNALLLKVVTVDKDDFEKRLSEDDGEAPRVASNKLDFIPYNSHNRIYRAWLFISKGRCTSFLPDKIASFIAVLECLFTTSNDELSHKVAERVAFYLGGSKEEKLENFKKVKEGYSVRSKYLHGQQLDKKLSSRDNLIIVSKHLDEILRQVMVKILRNDIDLFLSSNEKMEERFKDLLFD